MLVMISKASIAFSSELVAESVVNMSAKIAPPVCYLGVDSQDGGVQFPTFKVGSSSNEKIYTKFSIILYEESMYNPGCSSILSENLISLKFGDNNGQLDRQGFVAKGAGGKLRIAVKSMDEESVDYKSFINSDNNTLHYEQDFISKGILGFYAEVRNLELAEPGNYKAKATIVLEHK
ncbi:Fimbrial protein [Vibrio sp. B1REV9]|nr:Fimbrial protein [Vibrio sp. B1REV9]